MTTTTIRLATPEDAHLPWLDHTRANALHTCHLYGMVRYMNDKALEAPGRSLPLELGATAHRAFAAHRLWAAYGACPEEDQTQLAAIMRQGEVLFGEAWPSFHPLLDLDEPQSITLHAVVTSDYYDDPSDRRRTISNLEVALLHYLQRYEIESYPIYSRNGLVGVELPLSMVVDFGGGHRLIYKGRVDAICWDGEELLVIDNKTASNVANRWEDQWRTSHQITGYCLLASLATGMAIRKAVVQGLQVPLPKQSEWSGYTWTPLHRSEYQVETFLQWLRDAYDIYLRNKDNPLASTRHTHSCYRYFRPCELMPLCDVYDDDPPTMDELVDAPWDPGSDA